MGKHVKKEKNEILELIPGPEALIGLLIKDKDAREELVNELLIGGPKHKQIYSVLLANRMSSLVQTVKKITGESFEVQKGNVLTSHKEELEIGIPLVLASVRKESKEAVSEALSHAPAHEIIAFNALLQGIEWSIAALKKSAKEN